MCLPGILICRRQPGLACQGAGRQPCMALADSASPPPIGLPGWLWAPHYCAQPQSLVWATGSPFFRLGTWGSCAQGTKPRARRCSWHAGMAVLEPHHPCNGHTTSEDFLGSSGRFLVNKSSLGLLLFPEDSSRLCCCQRCTPHSLASPQPPPLVCFSAKRPAST